MNHIKTGNVAIGLIGLGNMGQNYLRILSTLRNSNLAFVYDKNFELAQQVSNTLKVPTGNKLEVLLQSANAVIICTPTSTHGTMLRVAAKYVQNIFIEKPLSHSLESSISDVEFIQGHGLTVQVGFIERFNSAVKQLKLILSRSSQTLDLNFTRTNRLSSRITDVDVVSDLMIHDIDLALYLNGPIETISAQGNIIGGQIAMASAQCRHENGKFSRLHASRITEKKTRLIQATCIDLFVDCELVRKEVVIHSKSSTFQSKNGTSTISTLRQKVEVDQEEALLSEIKAFIMACETGVKNGPDEKNGLEAAKVCAKIQKEILKWS